MQSKLSVVIIALNEALNLQKCAKSCAFADEILLVDSGSQDDTVAIAKRCGIRVIHKEWLGFGLQKQFAVQQASHNWVLCLDADEWVSEELANNISMMLNNPLHQTYQFARCNKFMGRFLRHGEGYPDLSLRLFNRHFAQWSADPVHEKVVTMVSTGFLKGDLMHESAEKIDHYLDKQNRYTNLQAEQLFATGKSATIRKIIISPVLRFIKFYLFRQGFRDGLPGLVHIVIGCMNSFYKYVKLFELQRQARK